MTPMSGALDWLAVGDVAEERGTESSAILGGGAARLAAHAAVLRARVALVAKVGEDDSGRRVRDALERLKVDLRWLRSGRAMRTTVWHEPALAGVDSVALQASDARVLFGAVSGREAVRLVAAMGPRLAYLAEADGSVVLREGGRTHGCPADRTEGAPRDRYAGAAAFWVG